MAKFTVIVEEVCEYQITVEATDEEQALELAETTVTYRNHAGQYFKACTGRDCYLSDEQPH